MRRLLSALAFAAGMLLLSLGLSTIASADNGPHQGDFAVTTDACAGCHRAHTAPSESLLKVSGGVVGLCFSCHDGTGSVLDAKDGTQLTSVGGSTVAGALRGGGFVNARIDSVGSDANYLATLGSTDTGYDATKKVGGSAGPGRAGSTGAPVTSAHIKSSSGVLNNGLSPTNTIWGNGAVGSGLGKDLSATPLDCADCHNPHGNNQFRILRRVPEQSGGTSVTLADPTTKTYTTSNYWTQYGLAGGTGSNNELSYNGTTGTLAFQASDLSNWCSECHTRYNAAAGSASASSGDTTFNFRHRSDGTHSPMTYGVTLQCLQCHVAHGSNAKMDGGDSGQKYASQVAWPDGTMTNGASTDSRLLKVDNRGTCVGCHNPQKGYPPDPGY